jgi:hypothetical protein
MTAIDTLPATAAPGGEARDTGLRVPHMLLTALSAAAGFNVLLGLEQQMADYLTRPGVGEWVCHFAGAIGPVCPTLAACAALALAGVVIGATGTQLFV